MAFATGCCGGSRGGRIVTVVAGPDVAAGARMTRPIDHYGVLADLAPPDHPPGSWGDYPGGRADP